MSPEIFLVAALVGAWFTFNAYVPIRTLGPLVVPSFFAGWLTSELAMHHLAWQLLATGVFVLAGALDAWPGWVGLGVCIASWAGLWGLTLYADRASGAVEAALVEGLGPGYRDSIAPDVAKAIEKPLRPGRKMVPFLLFDPEVSRTGGLYHTPELGAHGALDVYGSRNAGEHAPVLLQIHGGAWMIGEKRQQGLPLMLQAARAGWVCVASNYRLSPAATFPDHLVDVKRAIAWIRTNIAEYGGDPDLICITGGSAGGHLSSLAALTANDPEYQPGFSEVDTSVSACVPFYGVYDFTNSRGKQATDSQHKFLEKIVMKSSRAEHRKDWEKASPLFRIHPGAPPFFVIHGSLDGLASPAEARLFASLLRATAHEPVCYAEIPGAQHAFEVFHSKRTTQVVRGVERFLGWVVSRKRSQAPRLSGAATTSRTT
ncbi:MAG: alpha/beta hydrolase [Myxococcota bacterium]|jgi:acetyl esterase/lipase|nr:alpha/beta hydrolase [Deltaproteobacteria bacterium]MCP4242538.1 alpha/beta hydrolase fold domain-containing protein [bacterium]MDP6074384.1 alpha/beta hydrolase [Myxococcota bacterium]MDP7073769.1 alpha/beta hydrolase [Myxococcota bacterium]MDP7300104.1 alpha/beta hydrolase [Myxococcota bacterium]